MNDSLISNDEQTWLKRMQFLCKRGNLETELLLSAFVPTLENAPREKKLQFESLLQESDQNLFNWLLAIQTPTTASGHIPEHYQAIINEIRNNYLI
ncbi:succinate dehydrogenase assembly factor 2 [Thiomicrorhabdus sp.]|uniref:FAD assembly factor SdhE n=1 Tax=Thiomicrorhabdus sp. TaxID=2039724 RepID=UPI0035668C3B